MTANAKHRCKRVALLVTAGQTGDRLGRGNAKDVLSVSARHCSPDRRQLSRSSPGRPPSLIDTLASSAGAAVELKAGDTLTHSRGLVGAPIGYSNEMRLIRFSVAAKAALLRERTLEEIERLQDLGPRIITHKEVRPIGDARPINFLREDRISVAG